MSFPARFAAKGLLWVQWIHIIDLDRELFSVNSRIEQIYFSMDNIPRDRWTLAFKKDDGNDEVDEGDETDGAGGDDNIGDEDNEDGGSNVSLFEICPEATHEYPTHAYFADKESCEGCKAKYQSYNCSTLQARVRIDTSSKTADCQFFTVVMFEELMSPLKLHLRSYLPSWSYKDPAFRELAFAILSFAAGQYRFDEPQRLEGQTESGYLLDRSQDRPELLPLFGSGCHSPGEDAGSSPQDTITGSRMSWSAWYPMLLFKTIRKLP
jgi:hypothetical protein